MLTAIHTVPDEALAINSIKDIIQLNYTVHGLKSYKYLILPSIIRERYHEMKNLTECINNLFNGDKIVCIYSDEFIKYYWPESFNIHISKNDFTARMCGHIVPIDWPLLKRMNWILSKMNEGGLIELLYSRDKR